jgi:rhodanese-related sulfurtransferase
MAAIRGLPRVAANKPAEAGTCRAPEPPSADDRVHWISQEQAKTLVGVPGVAFVDCRPRTQFEAGHVSGALHLEPPAGPEALLTPQRLEPLAHAQTVITYCDAQSQCERSVQLARVLSRAGVRDVRVLEAGMPAWLERGYPAESGTCQQCESY